ncbi:hypothetical protein B0H13DRAFT_2523319 [Mycena leptocephala]|nr:hypothetical protein B0H13DRAFT_2523319 [Mycena leptocephala]
MSPQNSHTKISIETRPMNQASRQYRAMEDPRPPQGAHSSSQDYSSFPGPRSSEFPTTSNALGRRSQYLTALLNDVWKDHVRGKQEVHSLQSAIVAECIQTEKTQKDLRVLQQDLQRAHEQLRQASKTNAALHTENARSRNERDRALVKAAEHTQNHRKLNDLHRFALVVTAYAAGMRRRVSQLESERTEEQTSVVLTSASEPMDELELPYSPDTSVEGPARERRRDQ